MKNAEVQEFTTLDAYLAGFLSLHGFTPHLVLEGPKVVFLFQGSTALRGAIADYHGGAEIEAIRLALAIKALKGQIFAMKMNRGGH